MEDILKFIPIVLYVLYKLFGESKKKKQNPKRKPKASKKPTTSESTTSLEDILRELSGETEIKPREVKPQPKEVKVNTGHTPKERNKIDVGNREHDFRPEYEHHADVDLDLAEVRSRIRKAQGLSIQEEKAADTTSGFNLRQAIIAQTILNRPEY